MSQNIQTIEDLFALLHQLKDYPDGVLPTPTILPGTGFFPGALGLWNPRPTENAHRPPVRGIMVVGHNFDSEAGFARSHLRPGENMRGPTWRNLLAFLRSVNIAPEECFFTNAYVGLTSVRDKRNAFNRDMMRFTTTRQSLNGGIVHEYTRCGGLVLFGRYVLAGV